jgi:hypothetical protein
MELLCWGIHPGHNGVILLTNIDKGVGLFSKSETPFLICSPLAAGESDTGCRMDVKDGMFWEKGERP